MNELTSRRRPGDSIWLDLVDLQHLVTVMVDDLDGYAASLRAGNGRERVEASDAHAAASISAFSAFLSRAYGSVPPPVYKTGEDLVIIRSCRVRAVPRWPYPSDVPTSRDITAAGAG